MLSNLGKITAINENQLSKLKDVLDQLNNEQKIWLSGYLAGQVSSIENDSINNNPKPISKPNPKAKLTVLYGSQTGNARNVAENFFQLAQSKGIDVNLASMADFKPRQITKEHNLVLLVSTHGEGDVPDDAEIFYEYLFSDNAPQLKQLNYSVLALGDSSYEHFCQTGVEFDQRFEQLSANRIHDRVDCDLDYEQDAQNWQDHIFKWYDQHVSQTESDTNNVIPISSDVTERYSRNNPFTAEIITSQAIATDESVKVVYHIELSLEDSNIDYKPGDSLGVIASNPAADVATLVQTFDLDPKSTVNYKDKTHDLEQLLSDVLEISLLNKKFLTFYASKCNDDLLSSLLKSHEQYSALIKKHQLIDVVNQFPATVTAQELVDNLATITPRMYSIASSLQANPEEVHLTVALVSAEHNRTGLISGAFCRHLKTGDQIKVFVEPNRNFKLPDDPSTSIIMVGPGTGIAPFRGFLQERHTTQQSGQNWLFFGNPNFEHDFLYQLEWQQFLKDGVLNRIDLAFSRDQEDKIYVQDRIQEQSSEIWQWLQEGAHFYLCGDKDHMAKEVELTLLSIIQQHGDMTADEAQAYLSNLKKQRRYQKDVY